MVQEASRLALFLGAAKHWNVLNCWENSHMSCQGFAGSFLNTTTPPPPNTTALCAPSHTGFSHWLIPLEPEQNCFLNRFAVSCLNPRFKQLLLDCTLKGERHQDISDPYWWAAWNTTTHLTLYPPPPPTPAPALSSGTPPLLPSCLFTRMIKSPFPQRGAAFAKSKKWTRW